MAKIKKKHRKLPFLNKEKSAGVFSDEDTPAFLCPFIGLQITICKEIYKTQELNEEVKVKEKLKEVLNSIISTPSYLLATE